MKSGVRPVMINGISAIFSCKPIVPIFVILGFGMHFGPLYICVVYFMYMICCIFQFYVWGV